MYLVFVNLMLLMSGWRELPTHTASIDLGQTSLSALGLLGVTVEVLLVDLIYLLFWQHLYSIPFIRKFLPKIRDTPISHLIINCGLYVILSSALPLLVKVLGITNFDLLGNYGRIKWLRSFFIIFVVNLIFGFGAALCIFNRVTQKAREETINRIKLFYKSVNWNFLRNMYAPSLPTVATPVRMKAE
jgi:hypothetical protein